MPLFKRRKRKSVTETNPVFLLNNPLYAPTTMDEFPTGMLAGAQDHITGKPYFTEEELDQIRTKRLDPNRFLVAGTQSWFGYDVPIVEDKLSKIDRTHGDFPENASFYGGDLKQITARPSFKQRRLSKRLARHASKLGISKDAQNLIKGFAGSWLDLDLTYDPKSSQDKHYYKTVKRVYDVYALGNKPTIKEDPNVAARGDKGRAYMRPVINKLYVKPKDPKDFIAELSHSIDNNLGITKTLSKATPWMKLKNFFKHFSHDALLTLYNNDSGDSENYTHSHILPLVLHYLRGDISHRSLLKRLRKRDMSNKLVDRDPEAIINPNAFVGSSHSWIPEYEHGIPKDIKLLTLDKTYPEDIEDAYE